MPYPDNFVADHGTDVSDAVRFIIRKDEWIPSRPWFADIVFPDGSTWKGYAEFYRTKKSLVAHIQVVAPGARIEDAPRNRGAA